MNSNTAASSSTTTNSAMNKVTAERNVCWIAVLVAEALSNEK
jgi:hypothetical protein